MPPRRFDRNRLRTHRRAAEKSQAEVAALLEVAASTVAGWELGAAEPDQEKLPALARALGRSTEELFPRNAAPDLRDLRCDAGLYRGQTAQIIGTRSDGPVAGAEQGVRRLKAKYGPALASAYGVSLDELWAAQSRSFGEDDEEDANEDRVAQTLAEKIALVLRRSYTPGEAPSDAEIAEGVSAYIGTANAVTADQVARLRAGEETDPAPVVRQGLAHFLGVSPLFFENSEAVAEQVYEGLRMLSAERQGKPQVRRIRARGLGADGLPPGVMELLGNFVAELDDAKPEGE